MLNSLMRMEFLKEGRSIRLPILMIFYNSIWAFVTILFIFFHNESMQVGYYTGQSTFLAQFLIISSLQILSVFLIMPFSISSLEGNERMIQKQLRMIPGVIHHHITAKIIVLVASNLLIFLSSLPIISLSCIYSGISLFKLCRLFGVILLFSLWSGSIAIFCHSISRRPLFGFAGTLFIYAMFSIGIIMILEVVRALSLSIFGSGEIRQQITVLSLTLNLFNPITTYVGYYGNLTGNVGFIASYFGNFGVDTTSTLFSFLYYKLATISCIIVSLFFLYLSTKLFTHESEY